MYLWQILVSFIILYHSNNHWNIKLNYFKLIDSRHLGKWSLLYIQRNIFHLWLLSYWQFWEIVIGGGFTVLRNLSDFSGYVHIRWCYVQVMFTLRGLNVIGYYCLGKWSLVKVSYTGILLYFQPNIMVIWEVVF